MALQQFHTLHSRRPAAPIRAQAASGLTQQAAPKPDPFATKRVYQDNIFDLLMIKIYTDKMAKALNSKRFGRIADFFLGMQARTRSGPCSSLGGADTRLATITLCIPWPKSSARAPAMLQCPCPLCRSMMTSCA